MGKEKRKNRLDKGSSSGTGAAGGEFLGFGAFATPLPADELSSITAPSAQAALRWSPVYIGSDSQLSILFKKIGQKRDGSTKAKALVELQAFFEDDTKSKKEQAIALSHLLFLYHAKLNYDDYSSVRAASLLVIEAAKRRLPKAWQTLMDQQQELWGMIWCANADPAAEVKNAALLISISMEEWTGLWEFVTRMLSFGRAKTMHQELFARRSDDDSLTDAERDILDERFERIVGSSLAGVTLWLKAFPETETFSYDSSINDTTLWKSLTSSKNSLRLKAYALLGTMCQHAKSTVYGTVGAKYLPKLMPGLVSQEKEAVNIPHLFEVLLVYMNGGDTDAVNKAQLVKSLNKMLKNACYSSSPLLWGPAMLPLLVSIKEEELVVSLLSALLNGRDSAIGLSDSLLISSSVAEAAAYFLLREEAENPMSQSSAVAIAGFWLETLKTYLSTCGVTSVSREANSALKGMLGKTLCRLDEASSERERCIIYRERQRFWEEELPGCILSKNGTEVNDRFNKLIRKVVEFRKNIEHESRLNPILRQKFHVVLTEYQSHSGSVPSDQDYKVMQASLEFSSSGNIFGSEAGSGDETGLESFIMNDLLRWMVIHASELRTTGGHMHGRERAVRDFSLLRVCLQTIPSPHKQKLLWEAVLRELIAAKCDLGVLARGLHELCLAPSAIQDSSALDIIRCKQLDDLAIRVVKEALKNPPSMADAAKTEEFLSTSAGLRNSGNNSLVGRIVVSTWIQLMCTDQKNPFLSSILQIVLKTSVAGALPSDETAKVALLSWQVGGKTWESCTKLLEEEGLEGARKEFFAEAGSNLHSSLLALQAEPNKPDAESMPQNCNDWSQRALRWFSSYRELPGCQKFDVCGLGGTEIWRVAGKSDGPAAAVLFICLSTFLSGLPSIEERAALLLSDQRINLLSGILIAASDLEQSKLRNWRWEQTNCHSLVALVGGRVAFADYFVLDIVSSLVATIEEATANKSRCWTRRSVFATSAFLAAMLQSFLTNERTNSDPVDAVDVQQGDKVWYVASSQKEHLGEPAEIVKVHEDDLPRLYFTIKLEKDGVVQEKQTVAQRLRKTSSPQYQVVEAGIQQKEMSLRENLSKILIEKVVRPGMSSLKSPQNRDCIEATADTMNMVLSHCGVFGKAGIGSLRYELFQLLSTLQNEIIQSLQASKFQVADLQLRALSLALGFGELTYQSCHSLKYYNFDADPSLAALVALYKAEGSVKEIDQAALMWMTTSFDSIGNENLRAGVVEIVPMILSETPFRDDRDGLLAIEAMNSVLRFTKEPSNDAEIKAVSRIISAFATKWKVLETVKVKSQGTTAAESSIWWSKPLNALTEIILRNNISLLCTACRENAACLTSALSLDSKRGFAFRFLQLAARSGEPLRIDASEDMLPQETQSRLAHWKKGTITEDVEDLEDDILTVFEWVPSALMTEIESWIDDHAFFDEPNEGVTVARMLNWLVYLQYLEAAAMIDARHRMAFSAYAKKSGGVFFALSACVMFLNVELDRKSNLSVVTTIDDILKEKESMRVEDLSSATLFHTIEAFPTLSRQWWEDDCPKALSVMVSKFVQVLVAPETLRRELQRIEGARHLGEMSVRGSSVSREVTATYQQDECTLSIAIQIPPNFPLRSVDVDGRKTLGIPENRFKRWALQIRQILCNQDGTLLDALMLWKRNVEKEFEGVEPCPVCYSVLSVKTHELPNLECKTCSNTFHSSCLYKWFASSGKSQCVLCQQPWSGTRIN